MSEFELPVWIVMLYILPLFLAWRVRRSGRRRWALATLISLVFGRGLFVGLMALVVARKPVGPLMECPECGGPGQAVGSVTLKWETGEPLGGSYGWAILSLITGTLVCLGAG